MNKISKFLLSGAVVYSSAIAPILPWGEIPTTKQFFLDFTSEKNYSFRHTYAWFTGATCRAFTAYKLGEAFSDESLESKLIGSFGVGVALSGGFAKFLNKEICVLAAANIFLSGFTSAALAYIWHEDSDTSELDQVSGGLSQSLQEDISL